VRRSVKLTTSVPHITLEGILFTACPSSNLIAVVPTFQSTSKGLASPSDYYILPVSRLTSFSLLSLAADTSTRAPTISDPPVDLRTLRAREAAAVKAAQDRVARRGVGVSGEAQDIFDALARTYAIFCLAPKRLDNFTDGVDKRLPTRWAGTSIVVSDAVVIGPPYEVEDCAAPKESVTALTRVKRVLENEKRKIAERRARGTTATVATGVATVATAAATAARGGGKRTEEPRKGG